MEVSCLCRAGRRVEGAFGSDAKHCCGGSVDARENVTHPALSFFFHGVQTAQQDDTCLICLEQNPVDT